MATVLAGADLASAVVGALEVDSSGGIVRPWRLPAEERRYAPAALTLMAEFAAGVRIRLRTAASRIDLEAAFTALVQRGQETPANPTVIVAAIGGREVARAEIAEFSIVREAEDRTFLRSAPRRILVSLGIGETGGVARDVELWLPQDAGTELYRVSADAALEPAEPVRAPRWLHYGSSISHGGSADGPLGTWPRLASAALGLDGVNLGYGGNAMLDPFVAHAIAQAPADVITLKVGINIVGADSMRRRTFAPALHGFLDSVREGHPETPIALITAIACPAVESTPGPIRAGTDGRASGTPREIRDGDGTLTLQQTRIAMGEVVAARSDDDPALHLIDGLSLLGLDDAHLLPDGLHPVQPGHDLIARRFVDAARDESTAAGRTFGKALGRVGSGGLLARKQL